VWEGGVAPYAIPSKKLGMWLFIVSDALTFSALLIAYAYSRVSSDNWPLHFEFFPSIVIATVMTFALLTSSITMVMAVAAAKAGRASAAMNWLWATIAGGVIFLILHANEWNTLIGEGLRPFSNPWGSPLFGASFFTCTGLHMLHVTIGVIVLAVVGFGHKSGKYPADYVEIAGLYWHFVDLVWMFIFPLIYLMSIPLPGTGH
jgi:cytochrome c oxidase subunit 3